MCKETYLETYCLFLVLNLFVCFIFKEVPIGKLTFLKKTGATKEE